MLESTCRLTKSPSALLVLKLVKFAFWWGLVKRRLGTNPKMLRNTKISFDLSLSSSVMTSLWSQTISMEGTEQVCHPNQGTKAKHKSSAPQRTMQEGKNAKCALCRSMHFYCWGGWLAICTKHQNEGLKPSWYKNSKMHQHRSKDLAKAHWPEESQALVLTILWSGSVVHQVTSQPALQDISWKLPTAISISTWTILLMR